jgi:hypothetical protein
MLNVEVLTECAMVSCEPALLAFREMLTIEGLSLSIQSLVALPVFLAKLVMDWPLLPAPLSKSQGSRKQPPRQGQGG